MLTRSLAPIVLGWLVAVAGCQTTQQHGMMEARWAPLDGPSEMVPFSFDTISGQRGELYTTLGRGGEHYVGPYVLVEQSTQGKLVTEVWNGMSSPEWAVWEHDSEGHWHATGVSYGAFAHFYTGKAVALLKGNRGDMMRCQLHLDEPQRGPLAGGTGRCQTTVGDRVDLSFSPE
jgi:hypothetical protein